MNTTRPAPGGACLGCSILLGVVLFAILVPFGAWVFGFWGAFMLSCMLLLAGTVGILGVLLSWKPPASGGR